MGLFGFDKPTIATDASARLITSRRSFLGGAGATLIMAPSIVRATSLMNIRGEPLIAPPDEYVCAGQMLRETDDREMFNLLEAGRRAIENQTAMPPWSLVELKKERRFGGSQEAGTFAIPDFSGFKRHFGEHVDVVLDRRGDLFLHDTKTGEREKL
jgi:hypothetical protein